MRTPQQDRLLLASWDPTPCRHIPLSQQAPASFTVGGSSLWSRTKERRLRKLKAKKLPICTARKSPWAQSCITLGAVCGISPPSLQGGHVKVPALFSSDVPVVHRFSPRAASGSRCLLFPGSQNLCRPPPAPLVPE